MPIGTPVKLNCKWRSRPQKNTLMHEINKKKHVGFFNHKTKADKHEATPSGMPSRKAQDESPPPPSRDAHKSQKGVVNSYDRLCLRSTTPLRCWHTDANESLSEPTAPSRNLRRIYTSRVFSVVLLTTPRNSMEFHRYSLYSFSCTLPWSCLPWHA